MQYEIYLVMHVNISDISDYVINAVKKYLLGRMLV